MSLLYKGFLGKIKMKIFVVYHFQFVVDHLSLNKQGSATNEIIFKLSVFMKSEYFSSKLGITMN